MRVEMIAEDSKDIQFIEMEKAITPPSGLVNHVKNCYWVVHPTKGVVIWVKSKAYSPQCNSNEEITKRLITVMYPWAEMKFIPSVFYRINPQDWC